jgi:hypothetical protein
MSVVLIMPSQANKSHKIQKSKKRGFPIHMYPANLGNNDLVRG